MNEFQKAWLEGWAAARSRIVAELTMKHGPEGMKLAPKILEMDPPPPPGESRVEKFSIGGS